MNGVLALDSALYSYTGMGITWANEMKFVMSHAPGVESIAGPVDLQSRALPLYHGCPTTSGHETTAAALCQMKRQALYNAKKLRGV